MLRLELVPLTTYKTEHIMFRYTVAFTPSTTTSHQESLRRIHQFNKEELLWRCLEVRRRLRRKLWRISKEQHNRLDIAELANARPPEDLIGRNQRTY